MAEQINWNEIQRRPGKFEGEPLWVERLWEMALDGMADEDDGSLSLFVADDQLCADFPGCFQPGQYIYLEETEQGFVNSEVRDEPLAPVGSEFGASEPNCDDD